MVICEMPEYKKEERDVRENKEDVASLFTEHGESGENSPLFASDGIHFVHSPA